MSRCAVLLGGILLHIVLALPSAFAQDCVVCTNDATESMITKGKDCTMFPGAIEKNCKANAKWVRNEYCKLSCFEASRGYGDDICCTDGSNPAPSPTPPTGPPADRGEGEWGNVFNMGVIPIHTMLLPDGQVLSYGSDDKGKQGAGLYYALWDYAKGIKAHQLLKHTTNTDIFCSSLNVDTSTGNIIIMGGDGREGSSLGAGINTVLEYDTKTEQLKKHPKGDMNYARWYGTSVNLPNGDIFVIGGRDEKKIGTDIPEVWSPKTGFRALPDASVPAIANNSNKNYYWYPHTYVNSKAEIIVIMPRKGELYFVDVEGKGSIKQVGRKPFLAHPRSPSIMFRTDNVAFLDDDGGLWVAKISDSSNVTWKKVKSIGQGRTNGSMTMLPDGRVAMVGGASSTSDAGSTLSKAVRSIQIWDPNTNELIKGADQDKARLYHSTALTLPDGQVMSAGGGAPGPVKNLNGQLYSPAYIYDSNRPIITNCPRNIISGQTFRIAVDDTSRIEKVTATKSGSSSHTRNCDTRWLSLDFDILRSTVLRVHAEEKNTMIGGVWMLTVIDNDGIPSEACIVGVDMVALD